MADPVSLAIQAGIALMPFTQGWSMGLLGHLMYKKPVGPGPVDRGKQNDIRLSVPGYGEFIPKGWGIFRVAPIWVWESPAVDHPVTTPGQSGGKGPPKPPTATTVDHVYLKSVAGVFHDGEIYGGVRRIWFDNDLVASFVTSQALSSPTPSLLSAQKYEAEFGVLTGGSTVAAQSQCSAGKKITGLGSGGKVTITCTTAAADYELAVHYTSSSALTYNVYLDAVLLGSITCPSSGGASIVAIATYASPIPLTAGQHTFRFENAAAACPDLDCIDLAVARSTVAIDTRSFSSAIDVGKVTPANQDHGWAFNNLIPDPGDGGGAGGAAGTPFQTFNLGKYGQPSIRIYRGTTTQLADSAIVAQEGAASASAYRGFGVIVIEGLQMQFGRFPNVTLEVDQGVHSVPAIVTDIYGLGGITPSQLSVTALAGLSLGDSEIDAGTYAAVTYANTANVTVGGGGAIHKTSGADHAWNAYAAGNTSIASGVSGAIRFTADIGPILVGMGTDSSPTLTTDVIAGVILNTTSFPSLETKKAIQFWNGTIQSPDIGVWAPGDLFQFEERNGRFRIYQNGIEIQSFTPSVPAFPLFPQIMMYDTGAGVSALTVSTSGAIGDEPSADAGGLLLSSRRSAGELLSDLQTRFQFDMVEVDGVVKAILRSGSTADITIPNTDMRAVIASPGSLPEIPPFDCEIRDTDPLLLPARVDVNYLDPGMDYHNNAQSEMVLAGSRHDQQSVSLAIVDSADNIKKLAITLMHKAEMESRSFSWQTSWKYLHVHPGSICTLPLLNATHTVRVIQAKYGLPAGIIEFQGVRQAASLYSPTATGSISAGFEAPIAPIPANTKGVILDGPLFRPEDAGDGREPVVYVAMSGRGAGAWSGAFLYQEFPIGSGNYELVTTASQTSQIGVTVGALATVSDPSVFDHVSTLIINFYSDVTLASATEADLRANPSLNLLAIKNPATGEVECVQFKTATPGSATAPFISRYTVSSFLRGRVGTVHNVATHSSADDVVVVDSTLKPRRMSLMDIGRSINFKFVSSGQADEDVLVVTETLQGWSIKPLPPSSVRGARDSANNILGLWNRRGRIGGGLRSFAGVPLAEEEEKYLFEVYDGATLKRAWPVITGMGLAALLESSGATKFTDITVNTLSISGTGNTRARSLQQITETGNYIEATLSDTGTTATSGFGLIANSGDWTGGASAVTQSDYYVLLSYVSAGPTVATLKFYVDGVEVYSEDAAAYVATGIRVRITLSGSEVRFTKNWVGPGTPAQYASPVQPSFPLKVLAQVTSSLGGDHKVEKVVMTINPQPATIYTAAQATQDGLNSANPIKVRVKQISALVGPGGYTEANI